MKYKIGDIVEARGGLGFNDPGPWVILKREKIIPKEDTMEETIDLAAVYFGRYINSLKITRPGSFESNIEPITKPSKKEKEVARMLVLLFADAE